MPKGHQRRKPIFYWAYLKKVTYRITIVIDIVSVINYTISSIIINRQQYIYGHTRRNR